MHLSMSNIQGLLKAPPTVFQDLQLMKNTYLSVYLNTTSEMLDWDNGVGVCLDDICFMVILLNNKSHVILWHVLLIILHIVIWYINDIFIFSNLCSFLVSYAHIL